MPGRSPACGTSALSDGLGHVLDIAHVNKRITKHNHWQRHYLGERPDVDVSCSSKGLDALGPEFFDDAGEEHAVQTGLTGTGEFVSATITYKNTISRR